MNCTKYETVCIYTQLSYFVHFPLYSVITLKNDQMHCEKFISFKYVCSFLEVLVKCVWIPTAQYSTCTHMNVFRIQAEFLYLLQKNSILGEGAWHKNYTGFIRFFHTSHLEHFTRMHTFNVNELLVIKTTIN